MSTEEPRRDPVEELFARERTAIQNLPADDVHWQRLVGSARARRRSRHLRYAGAAAAVVLLASGVAWLGLGSHPVAAPPATRTATPGPVTSSAPAPSPTTSVTNGSAAYGEPVPKDFRASSMSNAGQGWLYVLGVGDCPGTAGRCPVLAVSGDDGRTWRTAHRFADASVPEVTPVGTSAQPASVLSQVRFASPQLGWVFGGGLQRTDDGGRTWRRVAHTGEAVLDLATDGRTVWVTAARGCQAGSCAGRIWISSSGVGDVAPSLRALTVLADPAKVSSAAVVLQGATALVDVQVAGAPVLLNRVDDQGMTAVARPAACAQAMGPLTVTTTADHPSALLGFCPVQGAAGSLGWAVSASNDAGRSWTTASTESLLLVNAGSDAFAAADRQDLLAVSGGRPDLHGSMKVSHDGGRTWSTPAGAPPLPDTGWRWVGAPGGPTYYALGGDGAAYWVSDDLGEHWHQVRLVR